MKAVLAASEDPVGDDLFLRKLKEYEGLIRYASQRYRVPGVLEAEDLFQEGLCILNEMFGKYSFEPDSVDFRKMFKTELWHGLWKVLQKHKTQKRDWKRKLNADFSDLERIISNDFRGARDLSTSYVGHVGQDKIFKPDAFQSTGDPEQDLILQQQQDIIEGFVDALIEKLDDDARIVLHELLYPRDWEDIPDEFKITGEWSDIYWRRPKKVPQHVVAKLLGWPLIKVRRAIKRIRREAVAVGADLKLDFIPSQPRRRTNG